MTYKVTVEPVLLLFFLCSFMSWPGSQDLIYTKVCLSKYSYHVCDKLYAQENEAALTEVQSSSSYWILGCSLLVTIPSIFAGQFIGSWSDAYGTKYPMFIPPFGGLFSSLCYIVLSVYLVELPLYLMLVPSFIYGITGGISSCILTCFNYISQITTAENRTMRIGILESTIFIAGCIGPLLGAWIQTELGRPFMFLATTTISAIIIIYIIVCVHNIVQRNQRKENWLTNFFRLRHLRECFKTAFRSRPENRRLYILLLLVVGALLKWSIETELTVMFLYVKDKPIEWNFNSYSEYWSVKNGITAFSLICFLPFLRKVADMYLLMIGLTSFIIGNIVLGLATTSTMMYIAAALSIFSSWCIPIVRSVMSKLVENNEKGKLFSCLATVENLFLTVGSISSNSLYPATRATFHGFVFIMCAVLLLIPFSIACFLHTRMRKLISFSPLMEVGEGDGEEQEIGLSNTPPPSPTSLTSEEDVDREGSPPVHGSQDQIDVG